MGAGEADELRSAAGAPLIAEYNAFLFATGADAALYLPQLFVLFPLIIDIADHAADADDQQKKQQIDVDGRLLTLRNARGVSRA
jgi:hypothetical protein